MNTVMRYLRPHGVLSISERKYVNNRPIPSHALTFDVSYQNEIFWQQEGPDGKHD
jgi:hypothetical protein